MSEQKQSRQLEDSDTDPGYRSRSQSRRNRRQRQKQQQQQQPNPMPAVQENQQAEAQATPEQMAMQTMQPFEYIGKDETSMNGPVTYAKAQRGEIPPRPGNPNQQLKTGPDGGSGGDKMMEQDGLKLRLELNLDVEVELKAKIYGDLTLALL